MQSKKKPGGKSSLQSPQSGSSDGSGALAPVKVDDAAVEVNRSTIARDVRAGKFTSSVHTDVLVQFLSGFEDYADITADLFKGKITAETAAKERLSDDDLRKFIRFTKDWELEGRSNTQLTSARGVCRPSLVSPSSVSSCHVASKSTCAPFWSHHLSILAMQLFWSRTPDASAKSCAEELSTNSLELAETRAARTGEDGSYITPDVAHQESCWSSIVMRILQKYLDPMWVLGGTAFATTSGAIRKSMATADGLISSSTHRVLGLVECKTTDSQARNQLIQSSLLSFSQHWKNSKVSTPIVSIFVSWTRIDIELHVVGHTIDGAMQTINMFGCGLHETENLPNLLYSTKSVLEKLHDNAEVVAAQLTFRNPATMGATLLPGWTSKPVTVLRNRVFEADGYIYKVFDLHAEPHYQPNFDTLMVPFLGAKSVVEIEGKLMIVCYKTVVGGHSPADSLESHFMSLHDRLTAVHKKGYIHGDVRLSNVIFGEKGQCHLIDFDLARKIGSDSAVYPPGYNKLTERHPDAKPGAPMDVSHDWHAFGKVVEGFVPLWTTPDWSKKQAVHNVFHGASDSSASKKAKGPNP